MQKLQRRADLLEASIEYLLAHGVGNLSLRPLAADVGSKARLLIYHFGSKDALIAEAMIVVRVRVQKAFAEVVHDGQGLSASQIIATFWKWATSRDHQPYLKLFFEVHGLALQNPDRYARYLEGAVASWVEMMAATLPPALSSRRRHALGSLAVGTVVGLLLDFLSSGNKTRTSDAVAIFADSFGTMVSQA